MIAILCAAAAACSALGQNRDVESWREDLLLDLPLDVATKGLPHVHPGGDRASDGDALALVARALFAVGKEEESATLLASAEVAAPSRVFVELELLRQALERDEVERVVRALAAPNGGRAPAVFADQPQSWLLLGRALARSGRLDDAVPLLEHFVDVAPLDPEAPGAWHLLAQQAIRAGSGERARMCADRSAESARWHAFYKARLLQVRENPREPLPRLGLAQLWLEARDARRAEEVLRELVSVAPDFARGWFTLGESLRVQGRAGEAQAAYSRALDLDNDYAAAHLRMARILMDSESPPDREQSEVHYRRYRELGGREPERSGDR